MSAQRWGLGLALTLCLAAGMEKRERVAPEESLAQVLAARIKRVGAAAVLREIYAKPEWPDVKAGIVSADSVWLGVGDALRVAAENEAADDLDLAFAEAIGHAPERVLEYAPGLDAPEAFADLCGALPTDAPVPQCRRALARRKRALLKLDESRWPDQTDACRAAIDSAYSQLDQEDEEGD